MQCREPRLNSSAIPTLAPFVRLQVDRITGQTVLLGPEVALELSDSGVEILKLCDGVRTASGIAQQLAAEFDADESDILADMQPFLTRLTEKGYVRWLG